MIPVHIATDGGLNSFSWEQKISGVSWSFASEGPDPAKEWEYYYRRGNTHYFRNKVLGQKFIIETGEPFKLPRGKYELSINQ